MRIVAVDIGNTRTGVGVFEDGVLVLRRDVVSESLSACLEADGRDADLCVVSCVRRDFDVQQACGSLKCRICRVDVKTAPLVVHYDYPERLGQDRIANAFGAMHHASGGAIVADFGTATHLDIVDPNGEFHAGPILAGVGTMIHALTARVTHLPSPDLTAIVDPIVRNTESGIQTGAILGTAGGVERMVSEIRKRLDYSPKVLITGGYAEWIAPHMQYDEWIPNLTLEGLCAYGMRFI